MTTLRDDTFTRADENPLASPYVQPTGAPLPLQLLSNAVGSSGTNDGTGFDDGNTYPEDQWCEVTVAAVGNSDGGPAVGLLSASYTGYFVQHVGQHNLYRINAGTFNLLASAAGSVAASDVLYLERKAEGADRRLIFKKNGATLINFLDTAPTTGGKPGINVYQPPGTGISFSRFKAGDFAGGAPTIASASDTTPSPGQSITVTVTGAGATQGASTLVWGGVAQTCTAWSDTSITFTADRGTMKNGVAANLVLTVSGVPSNNFALTPNPQAGWSFVNITSIAGSGVLPASPAIESGDQVEFEDPAVVAADATYDAPGTLVSFQYRVWDNAGGGWGVAATRTLIRSTLGAFGDMPALGWF